MANTNPGTDLAALFNALDEEADALIRRAMTTEDAEENTANAVHDFRDEQ